MKRKEKHTFYNFQTFRYLAEATAYIIDYVRFHNSERLHSGLNYLPPNQAANMAARKVSTISG
jgi:transposase InsO family protein